MTSTLYWYKVRGGDHVDHLLHHVDRREHVAVAAVSERIGTAGEQADRGQFDIALAAGDLAAKRNFGRNFGCSERSSSTGERDLGVAVKTADLAELTGDGAQEGVRPVGPRIAFSLVWKPTMLLEGAQCVVPASAAPPH